MEDKKKKVKKKPPTRKSTEKLISSYGLSSDAISVIRKIVPTGNLSDVLKKVSKFLLKGESKTEIDWLKYHASCIENHFSSKIVVMRPKSTTFHILGSSYTPDFEYLLENGQRVFVEVKGSKFQPNYRDARSKLKMTATLHWDKSFVEVMPDKNLESGWSMEDISPDDEYGELLIELSSYI